MSCLLCCDGRPLNTWRAILGLGVSQRARKAEIFKPVRELLRAYKLQFVVSLLTFAIFVCASGPTAAAVRIEGLVQGGGGSNRVNAYSVSQVPHCLKCGWVLPETHFTKLLRASCKAHPSIWIAIGTAVS